jgi:hypothetical protein
MADNKSHNINIDNEKKGSGMAKPEKHLTAKEVRHVSVALWVVAMCLGIVALGLASQSYLQVHEAMVEFEDHSEHADIKIKTKNNTHTIHIAKEEVEIVLDDYIMDEIYRNDMIQKKFTLDSVSSAVSNTVNRVVTDKSANALINSYTNTANDNSSLRVEINGVAGTKYVSLSTSSNSSPAPNLILLRNNNAFVGIGTVDPQATLHVNGNVLASTLTTNKLSVKSSATNKNTFVVTQDGKVGVGVDAPSKALQVNGDITADSFVLKSQDVASAACSEEGKIIFDKSTKKVKVCDGSNYIGLN